MAYTDVTENFLRYVTIDTQSSEEYASHTPSTEKQHDLARLLYRELSELGADAVRYDEKYCYVYAVIPSNLEDGADMPAIGFLAHMDTSSAVSGKNVKPRIIKNYDGRDIVLNKEKHIITYVADFPALIKCKGKSLIVTDGNTLLGGDDKAGVAEIMAMAAYLLGHPEVKHGKVCIGFTPDEEIGRGVDHFDIAGFGADYAYTVDGGMLGEINYECFHAADAVLMVTGKSVHPGDAKGVMKNAVRLVYEFMHALPDESPENTEGYEGFYHVDGIKGSVEEVVVEYIIRDHDRAKFEERKSIFCQTAQRLNGKFGAGTFRVELTDTYSNMREMIETKMYIVDNLIEAMKDTGVVPQIMPIRGGTDGARLSFEGLLCPNICTGTHGSHGRNEFACIEDMEKIVQVLLKLVVVE